MPKSFPPPSAGSPAPALSPPEAGALEAFDARASFENFGDENSASGKPFTSQWAARLDPVLRERLLAQHAADPAVFNANTHDGHTPLAQAILDGDFPLVAFLAPLSDLLLRSRAPRPLWTPLMHAVNERSLECVQILLEHNPAAQCALSQNTAPGQPFSPPLDMAIARDEAAMMELLLPWSPPKSTLCPGHVPGRTLLMHAAQCGSLDCAKALAKIDSVNACDSTGFSALAHAARHDREEVVEYLLTLPGIDADNRAIPAPDYGFSRSQSASPLVAALAHGHANIARILAPRSSMTEARTFEGRMRTPLMAAIQSGLVECVDLVLPFSAETILELSASDPDTVDDEEEERSRGEISNDQPTQKAAFEWALSEFQWVIADKIGAKIMALGLWSEEFDQQLLAAFEELEEYTHSDALPDLPCMLAEREAMELRQTLNLPGAGIQRARDGTDFGPGATQSSPLGPKEPVLATLRSAPRL